MAEKRFKMLRKEGRGIPYPYTKALFSRGDMKVSWMTKREIDDYVETTKRSPDDAISPAAAQEAAELVEYEDQENDPTEPPSEVPKVKKPPTETELKRREGHAAWLEKMRTEKAAKKSPDIPPIEEKVEPKTEAATGPELEKEEV